MRRARARRPERRRSHRVKWKPVYARLSSRVNPDHSSIVPQTGNPRPFQPFRPPRRCHHLRFLVCSPTGKPVSLERVHLFRAIEIDGAAGVSPLPHVPLDYYGQRMTREIFSWMKMARKRGRETSWRSTKFAAPTIFPIPQRLSLYPSSPTPILLSIDDQQSIKA